MSKTTNTSGLDIRFKINTREYRLRSSYYDFILEEVKIGQSGSVKDKEVFNPIGSGSTLNHIFQYLYKEHHVRTSEITEVIDLTKELTKVIDSFKETTRNITLECFISPEDRLSLVKKMEKYEDEIERLKSDNKVLRGKLNRKE